MSNIKNRYSKICALQGDGGTALGLHSRYLHFAKTKREKCWTKIINISNCSITVIYIN